MRGFKRVLVMLLVLATLGCVVLPAALAEGTAASNGNTFSDGKMTTYVGMKTNLTVYDKDGKDRGAKNFNWSSSKKKIASVSSTGLLTAKKAGTTTITATLKTNKKDKTTIKVTVKKNKIDNIRSKPSYSQISYKTFTLVPKSVEISATNKVTAEYYYVQNFPSSWKTSKLTYIDHEIYVWDKASSQYRTIVKGKVKNIKVSASGKKVKTVKAKFTGSKVKYTNLCLNDYRGLIYFYGPSQIKYKRPK